MVCNSNGTKPCCQQMDPARAWSRDQRDPSENHPTGLPGGRILLPPYNHLYPLPQPPSLPPHSHHHGFTLFSHLHLPLPNHLAPPYLRVSPPHSSSLSFLLPRLTRESQFLLRFWIWVPPPSVLAPLWSFPDNRYPYSPFFTT